MLICFCLGWKICAKSRVCMCGTSLQCLLSFRTLIPGPELLHNYLPKPWLLKQPLTLRPVPQYERPCWPVDINAVTLQPMSKIGLWTVLKMTLYYCPLEPDQPTPHFRPCVGAEWPQRLTLCTQTLSTWDFRWGSRSCHEPSLPTSTWRYKPFTNSPFLPAPQWEWFLKQTLLLAMPLL